MRALLVLALVLPACQRQPLPADELVVLIEQPPRNIDPRYTLTSYDFKLSYLCFARLVSVDDPHLEPHLELAERIVPVPATGQEPAWDVFVREARFSDGSPVTAQDVVYTLEQLLDERTGNSVLRRRFADAGLVWPPQVLGPRQLRLRLRHPHASILTDLDFGILKRGSIESGRLIGAGPFVPEGPVGEVSRFVANPHYFGGAPRIRRLTVRVVRDANARLLSLVGGSADLTQNTISPLLFPAIEQWRDRLRLDSGPSAILFYLGMNLEDPHLRDVRVRRALAHAIDRERIVRTKLHGRARLASSMLPALHWAYHEVEQPRYDRARAAQLLDEAGLPDPDGDGPRPRLSLSYKTSTDALPLSIARVIAAQLAEVGVQVEVRPYEFQVFLSDIKKGNFQLFTLTTGEVAEPNLMMRYFHSHYIPTPANPDGGHNRFRYRNAEVDALLEAGQREMDRARRKAIYARVQQILAQEVPLVPLWHVDNVVVMRQVVQGYVLLPSAQLAGLATTWKRP
ncbi:MAG: ABC transporter substrate-binding protein [Myxococcales bacterium]|nr:ABC transporter substrate-binding protein [Myxococcota bacterium]MDW8282838.1 ABC transporter substrate-binding protein [Myxococcales bacterium]